MIKKQQMKKIYVAMSGGVDSSVAAALLKKQGFSVVGVFFKPWQPEKGLIFCNWEQDRLDAMRVASKLGIKFKTWDFSKEYGKRVTKYMLDSYATGNTPNPDVMCNKEIKFGLFLNKALAEGADHIATGHYVKRQEIKQEIKKVKKEVKQKKYLLSLYHDRSRMKYGDYKSFTLLEAKDKNKDQSYFLWTLTQKQLNYCLFPIGNFIKPEVRKMAKKFGLPNHAKKDSQGVCFVGELNMHDFLTSYIKTKQGDIKLVDTGKTIGRHDGVYYYTIGQRHGLNITTGGGPYFVMKKNLKKNIVYVTTDKKKLNQAQAVISEISWINGVPKLPAKLQVKIRYRTKAIPAVLRKQGKKFHLKFIKPAQSVTSGQSAVFYRGSEMLGGGIII